MQYSLDDTIAAISTAPGEAGIGVVRISGPLAPEILQRRFRPARPDAPPDSHLLRYGTLVDDRGQPVDEVMAVWFHAPRSYTREEVVEIQSHGGATVLRETLATVLRAGARLAEPGEMTLRAFMNGRIDLAQAEAVLDVVSARTAPGLRAALGQLDGTLSSEIRRARAALIETLAHLTATIDFPEDDVPPQSVQPELADAAGVLERLLAGADRGILLREGVRVAIIGQPNVGKSSLLNRLLRHDRAIVTEIPGTTRDLLEESLNLRGVPLVLVDTAGIRETADLVESLGVARSREALAQADLILFVLDATRPVDEGTLTLAAVVAGRPVLVVENKGDQPRDPSFDKAARTLLASSPHLRISALTGEGMEALENAMWEQVVGGELRPGMEALVTSPRHKQAIAAALGHVRAAMEGADSGLPADFLTIDLHAAVDELGAITGESAAPDLLDAIFSRFCIGK